MNKEAYPKILVVDDLEANIFAMKKLLSKLEAEVHTASNGTEAIMLVKNNSYAVVIQDVQMPDMDGFETAKRMRELPRGKNLPIIFLTANLKDDEAALKGYDAGGVDYLLKPIDPDLLKKKIKAYLKLYLEMKEKRREITPIKPNILVVDDLEANLFTMKKLLSKLDASIFTAYSGEQAIEMVMRNTFAVVLLDVQMPQMDGFETAKRIRELPYGKNLPIIFVSANYKSDQAIMKGYDSGGVDYLLKPIDPNILENKVNAYIQLNQEMIEKQVLIEKLKLTQKHLELVNKKLLDYAHVISHDMKEPLRGICNYAEFLLEDQQDLKAESKQMLSSMQVMSKRAVQLLESMLEYSQVDSMEKKVEWVDMNQILNETVELLKPLMEQKNVSVEKGDSLPSLYIDRNLVSNLIRNLITNAIKYNDKSKINIQIKYNQTESTFSISDNGIGISPENYEKIFLPSKRLHKKDEYGGGTGFGLSLAKKIVEINEGSIWLESEVGKGTTFHFTLPKAMIRNSANKS